MVGLHRMPFSALFFYATEALSIAVYNFYKSYDNVPGL